MKLKLLNLKFTLLALLISTLGWSQYDGNGEFNKINSLTELEDGYYVIARDTGTPIMSNDHNGTFLAEVDLEPTNDQFNDVPSDQVWFIESTVDGYTIYNEESEQYISYTGSSNNVQVVSDVTGDNQLWDISFDDDSFLFESVGENGRFLQYNASAPRFACYTGTQNDLGLYKLEPTSDPNVPAVAAPTPTEDENDVISLFSSAYTDVPVDTWLTPWSSSQFEDVVIDGEPTKRYFNLDFAGIETVGPNAIDASEMDFFHMDVWSPNATEFRIKLVDLGDGIIEGELPFTIEQGEWVSLQIPLEDFADDDLVTDPNNLLTVRNSIQQLIISGFPTGDLDVYVDNIYFSQEPAASGNGEECSTAFVVDQIPFIDSGDTADTGDNYSSDDRPTIDNAVFTDGTGSGLYLNGNDTVYEFTPDEDGIFNFELSNIGTWVGFWLFEGCEPFTNTVAYSTTSSSNDRLLPEISLMGGETYYVVISTFPAPQTTPYTLEITEVDCANVSGLELVSNTNTSVEFSWDDNPTANDYTWFIFEGGADVETDDEVLTGTTSDTNAIVNDFAVDDVFTYDIYIQANCDAGESDLSGPVSFSIDICDASEQCNFTFQLTDSFGDGWNGNTMSVIQAGATVATIGVDFTDGTSFTEIVALCDGVDFELYWNPGGSFANEVGVEILDTNGTSLYLNAPGEGSQDSSLFTDTAECPECLAPSEVVLGEVGTSSIDFSWTGNDGADSYEWFIYEAGDDPENDTATDTGSTTETNAFSDNFLVTDVNSYDIYLLTNCEDSDSELVGPFSFTVSPCDVEDQCVYTFELIDSFGDGWNGNTMNVLQDDEVVATIGTNFTTGFTFTEEVTLCSDVEFELFWNSGGSFAAEVGVDIVDPDGDVIYSNAPGEGSQNTSLFIGTACPSDPVFANVQVIHNSPDPAASSVDVYLNGELLPDLTGVDFRTASEFLLAPANEEITIDIVPAGEDLADSVFTENFTLDEDENYIIVANGFVNADFELSVHVGAQQTSDDPDETAVLVHHGSPDAPVVNVANQETGDNLVSEIAFTEFAGYLDLLTDDYTLDITDVDGNVVASYLAPLSASNLGGEAITVIASGILTDPDLNNAFGLWVATAAGGDLIELPLIEPDPVFANVQVIHNSPDPAAASVDVFLNGEPVTELSDVAFRNASQFLPVPAEVEITIDIVPAGGELGDSVHTENFTLEEDENYIIVANGVLDSDDFITDNTFGLDVYLGARTVAENENLVDILVHHGSPDAPAVDVGVLDDGIVVNNIAYPEFEGYLEVDENNIIIELFATGGTVPVALYEANLADLNLAGSAITVVASGFFGDDAEAGNEFGLWVATAAGGALIELPPLDISTTDFNPSNFTYYPVPVKANLNIQSTSAVDQVEVFNTLGQRVISVQPRTDMPVIDMQALQTGVYLMKVSINGNEETFQVIKE